MLVLLVYRVGGKRGILCVPLGLSIALRTESAGREFARGASPLFLSLSLSLSLSFSFSLAFFSFVSPVHPVLSLFSQPRISSRHSAAIVLRSFDSILRQPFRYFFVSLCSATCRIQRFPTADRNNSACCFRSACLSNGTASSESHETFLNMFANIVVSQRRGGRM